MSRDTARILVASIAGLGVLAFALWLFLGHSSKPAAGPTTADVAGSTSLAESTRATLYFPGPGARLGSEIRELPLEESAEERTRRVVEALLAGPETAGHLAPLPEGVEVGSVFLAVDGTVFLDLSSGEGTASLAWGSKQELLSVYSLVNSVLANEPRARRVMLLWNGQQRPTFAGHVDLTRPLILHSGLLAPSAAPPGEAN